MTADATELSDAGVVELRVRSPKIIDGRIVDGEVVAAEAANAVPVEAPPPHGARSIDTSRKHDEVVALIGLGFVALLAFLYMN